MNELYPSQKRTISPKESQFSLFSLTFIAFFTLIMWHFIPFGKTILYPFVILGTWFHEMGHGIFALLLGADFQYLQIFSNGSGVAYYSGNVFFGNIGNAIIAFGGPIAPTVIGYFFIVASKNLSSSRKIILIFSVILAICNIIWVRSMFGFIFIMAFSVLFFISSLYGGLKLNKFICQFIGIQAFLSLYLSIDYLFSSKGTTEAGTYYSDTFVMEQMLFLPHYVWATIIVLISLILIFMSFKKVMR